MGIAVELYGNMASKEKGGGNRAEKRRGVAKGAASRAAVSNALWQLKVFMPQANPRSVCPLSSSSGLAYMFESPDVLICIGDGFPEIPGNFEVFQMRRG